MIESKSSKAIASKSSKSIESKQSKSVTSSKSKQAKEKSKSRVADNDGEKEQNATTDVTLDNELDLLSGSEIEE